ncbi:MAG: YhcN/YlaJ family sporulation lipoprotein [Anaerotignum sp.]
MWKKLLILPLVVFCFCGCSATATQNNLSGIHFVKADEIIGGKTLEERALSIKGLLHEIKGVSGNAVVVEGHTAIIGLRLESGMEDETSRLTKEADTAARQADENITNTSITTNTKIVALIEQMELGRGR